jgi:hypothetical protein
VGKTIGIILGVVIFAIMFPIVLDAMDDAQTSSQTDSFPGCVVAALATDVVLTLDLYEGRTTSVTAMTATGAGAVPVASTYTAGTNTLHITGLGADTPQDITVTYEYDRTTDFTGLSQFMRLTPLLLWLGVIFALIGGAFLFWKSRQG